MAAKPVSGECPMGAGNPRSEANQMAIKVKPIDQVVAKYVARAQVATPDYQNGIQNPKQDQAAAAAAAAPVWAQGVQLAVTNGSFVKGVQRNPGKWATNALGKGAQRYGPGVTMGKPNYQARMQNVLNVIANVTEPPRSVKGDPSNWQRSQVIGQALHAAKLAGQL